MEGLGAAISVLRRSNRILAYTGAGCSTESGIPDFRGVNGLWTRVDPDDFTIDRFVAEPEVRIRSWRMHQEGALWGDRADIRPNAAHHALTDLWRRDRLSGIVTQNVDGLHQASGAPDEAVAEVHGNVRKSLCMSCETRWTTEEVLGWVDAGMTDPVCPRCGGIVKTTTVMFGELLPDREMNKARSMAESADAVLVVGSTLGVYPAALVPLSVVQRGAPMVIVNIGPTDHDELATVKLETSAGATLAELIQAL
ncbi:MAG TPA: Sir2 family NAD-dependent protein deacetylase [Acidimicrobiia bacterium]|nr:Sir2 family NAD-dependent protein deacetylase [Acidimicrobiia bacterium]